MKIKTNYHTHTTYCDGKDNPEQIISVALDKGFSILGFSGHTINPLAADWHISAKEIDSYVKEIKSGTCEIDLSNEEKNALSQAMKKS